MINYLISENGQIFKFKDHSLKLFIFKEGAWVSVKMDKRIDAEAYNAFGCFEHKIIDKNYPEITAFAYAANKFENKSGNPITLIPCKNLKGFKGINFEDVNAVAALLTDTSKMCKIVNVIRNIKKSVKEVNRDNLPSLKDINSLLELANAEIKHLNHCWWNVKGKKAALSKALTNIKAIDPNDGTFLPDIVAQTSQLKAALSMHRHPFWLRSSKPRSLVNLEKELPSLQYGF